MSQEKRYQAKREGAHGAQLKDLKTGRIIAHFEPDPDKPGAARWFAEQAAEYYNFLLDRHEEIKKKRKW